MNLPFHIAKRYIFAKKSHNAVNIISAVSICGITLAATAMVCILSIYNGLGDIGAKSFSAFDPELQITPKEGKVFDPSTEAIQKLKELSSIDFISESLEENALLKFQDRQEPILLKGVTSDFVRLADINSLMVDGEFELREGDIDYCVIGAGLATTLGVRAKFIAPLEIYMPKRNEKVNLANPSTAFTTAYAYTSGVFALNQAKYDDQMLIISIDLMRELLRYENEVSSLDIKLKEGVSTGSAKKEIKAILGDDFYIKDRFEQQADTFRMINMEKWITFLILSIILLIAAFNVVSSLSMLILEKTEDIRILQNMGASKMFIAKIFFYEGFFIVFLGAILGIIIGLALCLCQQYLGLIKFGNTPGAFVVDAYPVVVQSLDILFIFITVIIIGLFTVLYPVNNLKKNKL